MFTLCYKNSKKIVKKANKQNSSGFDSNYNEILEKLQKNVKKSGWEERSTIYKEV
ncbi:nitrogenase molybdenum-iron protein, alpha and beta chains [Candidatus Scalindua japonica]|uniref:Nitrogenase molybdenum-iron protein, alpha and beta chains n=1 Tax=Candidatus Scalindua japonica TaxID=1284222 RepID=A0A286TZ28_9BACT|nr:nitrogenase molybdenum-iron protein, alpha and beta chains [Candidatus Scalindua japonica]